MKTAEEWTQERADMQPTEDFVCSSPEEQLKEFATFVRTIQLDAERSGYERGLREAADVVKTYCPLAITGQTCESIQGTILSPLTTKPEDKLS